MATVITEECINCGACEPECPNTAIYQGGVEYEWQGKKHPALKTEFFYIVPEKCTECVGFFDQEACAAVCPVDCCVPDPERPESEELLLERARGFGRRLHRRGAHPRCRRRRICIGGADHLAHAHDPSLGRDGALDRTVLRRAERRNERQHREHQDRRAQ